MKKKKRIKKLEGLNKYLEGKLVDIKIEVHDIKDMIRTITGNLDDVLTRIDGLTRDNNDLYTHIGNLKNSVYKIDNLIKYTGGMKIVELTGKVKILEAEIMTLKSDKTGCPEALSFGKLKEVFEKEYKKVPEEVIKDSVDCEEELYSKCKVVVKSKKKLLKWFEDRGCKEGYKRKFTHTSETDNTVYFDFYEDMFSFCNKEIQGEWNDGLFYMKDPGIFYIAIWHPDWIEQISVEAEEE